jgi:hypothetical protein
VPITYRPNTAKSNEWIPLAAVVSAAASKPTIGEKSKSVNTASNRLKNFKIVDSSWRTKYI